MGLRAVCPGLFALGGRNHPIMIEVLRVEMRERLRLGLRLGHRLRLAKQPGEHMLRVARAFTAGLGESLLCFRTSYDAIVIEVETLEHHVGELGCLLPGHITLHETAMPVARLGAGLGAKAAVATAAMRR